MTGAPEPQRPEAVAIALASEASGGAAANAAACIAAGPASAGAGTVVVFPRYAQRLHTAETSWEEHTRRALVAEPLLGIGLTGARTWVRSPTGDLPLLR